MQLVIIGGSDAGISAALRARECDPTADVTVIVADSYPNYSICGLPFFLSGETPDWHSLAHRTAADIAATGVELMLDTRAERIDPMLKRLTVRGRDGEVRDVRYDRLIIGTGAEPTRPFIAGLDTPGVFLLHTMDDSFAVSDYLEERKPQTAVIVGGGYIGTEMADALTHRGIAVTLVEHAAQVLKTVDPAFGALVRAELEQHGVRVVGGVRVENITPHTGHLEVRGAPDFAAQTDMVLVAVGVRPQTALAQTAGVEIGRFGAIRVNRAMATNVPDVWAAGDCVETWHRVMDGYTYLPLGTTSHKQGRVAGENAVGGQREFAGVLGTQAVKIFGLIVGRTGLRDYEAQAGDDPVTIESVHNDHKAYYPGAQPMHIRVTGDRRTGRLLGAQIAGRVGSEVSKRIDIFAAAIYHGLRVEEMNDLDLSYTPPLSSPWDPVQMAAQVWGRAVPRGAV